MVDKDQVVKEIIDAAAQVIGRYGYKKTTMDDIALAAKRGKTSIYYYFKNKEEIFLKVIEKEAKQLIAELTQAVTSAGNSLEKLLAYMNARIKIIGNVSISYDSMKTELLEYLDYIEQGRKQYDIQELELVTSIIAGGVEEGVFNSKNPQLTAFTIVAALKGLEVPFFGKGDPADHKDKVEELIKILIYGITGKQ